MKHLSKYDKEELHKMYCALEHLNDIIINHKDYIVNEINKLIQICIDIFSKYDRIKLLGYIGLRLIRVTENTETLMMKQLRKQTTLPNLAKDEVTEVLIEYAQSIATAIKESQNENPTPEICRKLYDTLKELKQSFNILDIADTVAKNQEEKKNCIKLMQMSLAKNVRGDGFMTHIEEVYTELFTPHSTIIEQKYGFTIQNLYTFATKNLFGRISSKITSDNSILGAYEGGLRLREWLEVHDSHNTGIVNGKSFIEAFLDENPDLRSEDGQHVLMCQHDDYESSDKIFWIYPQNAVEEKILQTLSISFGDNEDFLNNPYKGYIQKITKVTDKPFIKVGEKYYCFSELLVYRNLSRITENLLREECDYYKNHYLGNVFPECRDNYVEGKVLQLFKTMIPNATWRSSVSYKIIEDNIGKKPELDILGFSDNYVYIVEVKAHQLTNKDKLGNKGLNDKLEGSVIEAATQAQRAFEFYDSTENPTFTFTGGSVSLDKSKHKKVFKIAVTYQHFSSVISNMKSLVNSGLMPKKLSNTWIASLYDLMVFADFEEFGENEFVEYMDLRLSLNDSDIMFFDELDLFGHYFMKGDLKQLILKNPMVIDGGIEELEEDYNSDYVL